MIIKEKELKDLQISLEKEREEHYKKVKALEEEVSKLKKVLKPDHIVIEYLEYLESHRPVRGYNSDFIKSGFDLSTNITLSNGIRRQILGLLRGIKQHLSDTYVTRYIRLEDSLKKEYQEKHKLFKQQVELSLIRTIKSSSIFNKTKLLNEVSELCTT